MKRNVSKEVAGKIIKALNSNIMLFDKTISTKAKDASVKRISGVSSTYPRDLNYVRQDCSAFLRRIRTDGLVGDPIRKLVDFLAGSFDRWALFFNPPSFQHFAYLDILKHFMVD